MVPRRAVLFAASLLALSATGCVRETVDGSVTRIGYELWMTALWVVAGLVAVPAGWVLRPNSPRIGWPLLIAGPILLFGVAPTAALTTGEINDEGFAVRSGVWGATAGGEAKFADVSALRQTSEKTTGRRGRKKTTYYLNYDLKTGGSGKISLGNDVAFRTAERIIEVGTSKGIPYSDLATE